jgi:hypothetical protein
LFEFASQANQDGRRTFRSLHVRIVGEVINAVSSVAVRWGNVQSNRVYDRVALLDPGAPAMGILTRRAACGIQSDRRHLETPGGSHEHHSRGHDQEVCGWLGRDFRRQKEVEWQGKSRRPYSQEENCSSQKIIASDSLGQVALLLWRASGHNTASRVKFGRKAAIPAGPIVRVIGHGDDGIGKQGWSG